MEKLINFKLIKLKPLYYTTKIKINNKIPNLNNWNGISNNQFSLFHNDNSHDSPIIYESNIDLPLINAQLSHMKIDKFFLVINITDSTSLFTAFQYQKFINDSNIDYYLNIDESMMVLGKYLYDKLYHDTLVLNHISFTNRYIKHIPLTLVNNDTLYYYNDNYDIDSHFNCFKFKSHIKNIKKISVTDLSYQPFTEHTISWFFDRLYSKQLHRYFNNTMIITTKNRLVNYNYIYLNQELQKCINIYYNWFQTTNNSNLDLKKFTILIYSFYFSKLNQSFTIFYDFYIECHYTNDVSLYSNQNFVGICHKGNSGKNFNDFINNFLINKVSLPDNIELKYTLFDKIILVDDIIEIIYDDDYVILPNKYNNINDIISIKTKIGCNDILIFNNLSKFKEYRNIIISLPKKTSKFILRNDTFYRIMNEFKNHYYILENIDKFILGYDEVKLNNLKERDFDNYKSEVLSIIDNYQHSKIIITYLINDNLIMTDFIKTYLSSYPIIIINIMNIENFNFSNFNNILVIENFPEIMNYEEKFIFINPNFFISELGYFKYHKYNLDNKNKTYSGVYLTNSCNKSKIPEIIVKNVNYKLKDKIKIKNLSHKFDV